MFAILALIATWSGPVFSATSDTDGSGQLLLAQAATPRATAPKPGATAAKRKAAPAKRKAAPAKKRVAPAQRDDNPTIHPPGQQHG